MSEETLSGADLEQALAEGSLAKTKLTLVGAVKVSDQNGYISFSQTGPAGWVDIPTALIKEAVKVGMCPCPGESHPMVRLTFADPEGGAENIYHALLVRLAQGGLLEQKSAAAGTVHVDGLSPEVSPYEVDSSFARGLPVGISGFRSSARSVSGSLSSASMSATFPGSNISTSQMGQFYPPWEGAYPPRSWDTWECWGAGCGGGTLPHCGYKRVVCGSSLPGYPPIMCTIYCCTYPSGMNNCAIV